MRFTTAVCAALLASSTSAAPTPGLISSILGQITSDLNSLLSSLHITKFTNASSHGPALGYHSKCPFNIPSSGPLSLDRHHHDITWPKAVNGGQFLDWKTFKANGVNLGGWLEKEKTHDPIW